MKEQIDSYIGRFVADRRSDYRSCLTYDLQTVLGSPPVRRWVLNDDFYTSQSLWAALVADFADNTWKKSSELTGRYIRAIVPTVKEVVRSVAGIVRLGWDHDFRVALSGHSDESTRMALFAPLATFFLQSLGRGEVAWDILVEPKYRPRRVRPFSWVALSDGLYSAVRFLLTSQAGRGFLPKAFLYSPLSRYLQQMNVAKRARVVRSRCPKCGEYFARGLCPNCEVHTTETVKTWLLSTNYLERCEYRMLSGGHRVVAPSAPRAGERPVRLADVAEDLRTGRRAGTIGRKPGDFRADTLARQGARMVVAALRRKRTVHFKQLLLCAELAGLDDARPLFYDLPPADSVIWDALAEALLERRIGQRARRVETLNRWLPLVAAQAGVEKWTAFTENQVGTYLARVRRRFMDALRKRLGAPDRV
ncbi:MAG: hypothetical protein ACYTF6_13755 [Planctomycetota bacterium]